MRTGRIRQTAMRGRAKVSGLRPPGKLRDSNLEDLLRLAAAGVFVNASSFARVAGGDAACPIAPFHFPTPGQR